MAFDGIETAMENNRLARRLSGGEFKALEFDLLHINSHKAQQLVSHYKKDTFEEFFKQPTGHFQFKRYLKYDSDDGGQNQHVIYLIEDVEKYRKARGLERKLEAEKIMEDYLLPSGADQQQHSVEEGKASREPSIQHVGSSGRPVSPDVKGNGGRLGDGPPPAATGALGPAAAAGPSYGSQLTIPTHVGVRQRSESDLATDGGDYTPRARMSLNNDGAGALGQAGAASFDTPPRNDSEAKIIARDDDGADGSRGGQRRDGPPSPRAPLRDEKDSERKSMPGQPAKVNVPKHLLDTVKQKLLSDDPGQDLFDPIVQHLKQLLVNDYYPKFLQSEEFLHYVQLREYCGRGQVSLNDFISYRVIGKGAFGKVCPVSKIDTGALYAMKEMSKRAIKAADVFRVAMNERNILAMVSSPFVTRLRYAFQTRNAVMLVMDYCSGGDLKWHLRNVPKDPVSKRRHFSEELVRFYAAETLLAVEHLHGLGVVYRDLKPHNLLLTDKGHLMLSDMGLAEILKNHKGQKMTSLGGTPGYWAPQVISRSLYAYEADVWSFGILLYTLVFGEKPRCTCVNKKRQWCTFVHSDSKYQEALAKEEKFAAYNPDIAWPPEGTFSPELEDLIKRCLEIDPDKRITIKQLKEHAFFKPINFELLEGLHVKPPWVPPSNEVHADSLAEVGELDDFKRIKLTEEDQAMFSHFDYYSEKVTQEEVVEAMQRQIDRYGSKMDLNHPSKRKKPSTPCCIVL